MKRPCVLTIAGFDPSGGAGILSDAKTMEANKVMGLGVISAITFQNENQFTGLEWTPTHVMFKQLDILFEKYNIKFAKIGLIENLSILTEIVDYLIGKNSKVKIVWDPVLKASAGYTFHSSLDKNTFENICKKIYLITPNWIEMQTIYPEQEPQIAGLELSKLCIVYLKGGHNEKGKGKDYLFEKNRQCNFNAKVVAPHDKHGSGCVLSASLTAFIARDFPIRKACLKAKHYVTHFLLSNQSLLGYHK